MYKKLTESEKKELEKFPKYDEKLGNWVGSREYWEAIFESETNRDPEIHKAFSELHEKIVNLVISFCKEHNLTDIDEFSVYADGLEGSIQFGEWEACTDSTMSIIKLSENVIPGVKEKLPDREHPFLYEI